MTTATRAGVIFAVPLTELHPNPANPRSDLGDLTDLVDSISEHGVLSPLLATKRPAGGLVLVAGHRRLAACKLAKLATAPTIVLGPKLADDHLTIAIVENLHRAQLSPMDEARACQALLDHGRSKKDIAVDLARSNGWIADRLALMELPRELQRKVDSGDLTIGQGAQLGHGLKKRGTASVVTGARSPFHFTHGHPLADCAIERCDAAKHPTLGRIGPACGACWEQTIRDHQKGAQAQPPPRARTAPQRRQTIDEVAVQRRAGGDRSVKLNVVELAAAIDLVDRHNASAAEVAERLGTTPRSVQRRRAERRSDAS